MQRRRLLLLQELARKGNQDFKMETMRIMRRSGQMQKKHLRRMTRMDLDMMMMTTRM